MTLTMTNTTTNYTKQQLVDALCAEYDFYCREDFNPDEDLSSEDYRSLMMSKTHSQLVKETGTDDEITLQEFMSSYGEVN